MTIRFAVLWDGFFVIIQESLCTKMENIFAILSHYG